MSADSAFPTDEWFNETRIGQWPGMTLRDYFAAAALTGELAACVNAAITPAEAARRAFATADEMLAARKGRREAGGCDATMCSNRWKGGTDSATPKRPKK